MNLQPLRYAISDRNLASAQGWASPVYQAAQLAGEGVDFFQLREKDLPAGKLARLAREVLHTLTASPTRLLINGRADVAIAIGAHGVHLFLAGGTDRQPDSSPLRRITITSPLGHRLLPLLAEVTALRHQPLTAILFGPVFGKTVKGQLVTEALGLDLLGRASRIADPIPVLALGGVTQENAASCLAAGAAGFAGIRLFQRA